MSNRRAWPFLGHTGPRYSSGTGSGSGADSLVLPDIVVVVGVRHVPLLSIAIGPACGLPWSGLGFIPGCGWRRRRRKTALSCRRKPASSIAASSCTASPTASRSTCLKIGAATTGKLWPIILFLHGRGERGSEGMWQTQIGLPEAVRDHPERWPFVIVMPQCPLGAFWTDPACLQTGHGRARPGDGRVPRRPGPHLSHRPFPGRIRRLGAGAPPSPSLGRRRHCRRRHLLELRPGALAAGLDSARPSTPTPSAAPRSGSSTEPTTPWLRPARAN